MIHLDTFSAFTSQPAQGPTASLLEMLHVEQQRQQLEERTTPSRSKGGDGASSSGRSGPSSSSTPGGASSSSSSEAMCFSRSSTASLPPPPPLGLDPEVVLELVESGADVCYHRHDQFLDAPILHTMIGMGRVECVLACLRTRHPINFSLDARRGASGRRSALHLLCELASPYRAAAILRGIVERVRHTTGVPPAPNAASGSGKTKDAPAATLSRRFRGGLPELRSAADGPPRQRTLAGSSGFIPAPLSRPPRHDAEGAVPGSSGSVPRDVIDWGAPDARLGLDFLSMAAHYHLLSVFWPIVKDLPYFQQRLAEASGGEGEKEEGGEKQNLSPSFRRIEIHTAVFPLDWAELSFQDRQRLLLTKPVLTPSAALARLSSMEHQHNPLGATKLPCMPNLNWIQRYVLDGDSPANVLFHKPGTNRPTLHEFIFRGQLEALLLCLQTPHPIDFTVHLGRGGKTPLHLLCRVAPPERAVAMLEAILKRLQSPALGGRDDVNWSQLDGDGNDFLSSAAESGILSLVWPVVKAQVPYYQARVAAFDTPAFEPFVLTSSIADDDWAALAVVERKGAVGELEEEEEEEEVNDQRYFTFSEALVPMRNPTAFLERQRCIAANAALHALQTTQGDYCSQLMKHDKRARQLARLDHRLQLENTGANPSSSSSSGGGISQLDQKFSPLAANPPNRFSTYSACRDESSCTSTPTTSAVSQIRKVSSAVGGIQTINSEGDANSTSGAFTIAATVMDPRVSTPIPAAAPLPLPSCTFAAVVKRCAEGGADVCFASFWRRPMLHHCIRWGLIEAVRSCLVYTHKPIDFTLTGEDGNTALHWIPRVEDPEKAVAILELVLQRLRHRDKRAHMTTLHRRDADVVDWGQRDAHGHDFISCAAAAGYLSIFWPLLRHYKVPFFMRAVEAAAAGSCEAEGNGKPFETPNGPAATSSLEKHHLLVLTCPPSQADWEQLRAGGWVLPQMEKATRGLLPHDTRAGAGRRYCRPAPTRVGAVEAESRAEDDEEVHIPCGDAVDRLAHRTQQDDEAQRRRNSASSGEFDNTETESEKVKPWERMCWMPAAQRLEMMAKAEADVKAKEQQQYVLRHHSKERATHQEGGPQEKACAGAGHRHAASGSPLMEGERPSVEEIKDAAAEHPQELSEADDDDDDDEDSPVRCIAENAQRYFSLHLLQTAGGSGTVGATKTNVNWGTLTLSRLCGTKYGPNNNPHRFPPAEPNHDDRVLPHQHRSDDYCYDTNFPLDGALVEECIQGREVYGTGVGAADVMYQNAMMSAPLLHQFIQRGATDAVLSCLATRAALDFTLTDRHGRNTPLHLLCFQSLHRATAMLHGIVQRLRCHPEDEVDWAQENRAGKSFLTLVVEQHLLSALWPILREAKVPFFALFIKAIPLQAQPAQWDWEQLSAEDQSRFALPLGPFPHNNADDPREANETAEDDRALALHESGAMRGTRLYLHSMQHHEKESEADFPAWPPRTAALGKRLSPYLEWDGPTPLRAPPRIPPLHSAAALEQLEQLIVAEGGDVMYMTPRMRRPILHELVYRGEVAAVRLCLEKTPHSIDFTRRDWFGRTLLHYICHHAPSCTPTTAAAPNDNDDDNSTGPGEGEITTSPSSVSSLSSRSSSTRWNGQQEDLSMALLQLVLVRLSRASLRDVVDWGLRDDHGHDFLSTAAQKGMLCRVWPVVKYQAYYAARSAPVEIMCEVRLEDWTRLSAENQKCFLLTRGIAIPANAPVEALLSRTVGKVKP